MRSVVLRRDRETGHDRFAKHHHPWCWLNRRYALKAV
jgi:hypothetical protein